MVRRSLVVVFMLLVLNVPVAEAASPAVVSGTLRDELGNASSGNVVLFHFNLGELSLVTRSRTGTGNFALRASPTAAMKEAARKNNGYVHFMLMAFTDRGARTVMFSRRASGTTWSLGTKALEVLADREMTAEERQEAQAYDERQASGGMQTASAYDCLPSYDLVERRNQYTMVGELHVGDGMEGTFTYGAGNTADTEMSAKVSVDGGNWQAGGTVHVGTTDVAKISRSRNYPYGYGVKTNFTYGKFKKHWLPGLFCLLAPNYMVLPLEWNSGVLTGWDVRYLDNKCHTDFRQWSVMFESGDSFSRERNALTWYGGAAKVFGAGIETKSGASFHVKYEYKFSNKRARYRLCGNNDFPPRALRIFAGP